jgi:hypothetical protein
VATNTPPTNRDFSSSALLMRPVNEDFQVIRLPQHRLYPHRPPTKHQLFHRGVIAEISVRRLALSSRLRESRFQGSPAISMMKNG